MLELLLARAASPLVLLEPLRGADVGLPARDRDALLGQLVRRRIADMRETAARLAAPPPAGRAAPTLPASCGSWPTSRRSTASGR